MLCYVLSTWLAESELAVLSADSSLAARLGILPCRYNTILAPAMHMVRQRLSAHETQKPATPEQEEFASKHLPAIRQAAATLASPSDDMLRHPQQIWHAFKAVSKAIAQQQR